VHISFTVCLCVCVCVCVFVWLWIFLPRIELAASNFARWFIGVQGRESSIFVNFAPPEAQNRPARPCCNVVLLGCYDSHAYQVYAACGRRISMCGYTSVPEDGRTCSIVLQKQYHLFRSTPPNQSNKVGLKCPSVRPSVRKKFLRFQ